jgi:hypothetical protein
MNLLERQPTHHQPSDSGDADSGSDAAIDALRQRAESQWQHIDDRLDQVMSGDSQAFLASTRQQGGQ